MHCATNSIFLSAFLTQSKQLALLLLLLLLFADYYYNNVQLKLPSYVSEFLFFFSLHCKHLERFFFRRSSLCEQTYLHSKLLNMQLRANL